MPATKRKAAIKTVIVTARYALKRNGHVIYACRGSHDETYCTTVINGIATGCGCPARLRCKHMDTCQQLEQARKYAVPYSINAEVNKIVAEADITHAYEVRSAQIAEKNAVEAADRAYYNALFDPNYCE